MGNLASEDIKIQGLIDSYLRLKVSKNGFTASGNHLDEDLLTTFIEGNLSYKESEPLVNHLTNCSYCRQVTGELVKLDLAFAGDQTVILVRESEPLKFAEVLNNLLLRIFGTDDGVVFAHQEQSAEKTETAEDSEN